MNLTQKKLLLVGLGLIVLTGLIPPWKWTVTNSYVGRIERPSDYSFIGDPPKVDPPASVQIDYGRLLLQWTIISLAAGVGIFYYKDQSQN